MIAISDSCFNLIYLLKRLQGFERHAQCIVISQYFTLCNVTPQLETVGFLAFCASTLFIFCRSNVSWAFGECWNIFVLQQLIAMKTLFCNGCRLFSHLEDTVNVEHQFSDADVLKRSFKHRFVGDIHPDSDCNTCSSVCFPPKCWTELASAHMLNET